CMAEPIEIGLTFDDVLLVPQRSAVSTRRQADTRTRLCRGIELAIPVVSASMDTVTEAAMASVIAREGGIGIIHRFLPIADHVAEVRRVKRAESVVIETPYTVGPEATIRHAAAFMEEHGSAGILVIDRDRRLLGIVTARDVLFEEELDRPITAAMTPRARLITAPAGTPIEQAKEILHRHRIEKLPLVDAEGRLVGLVTSRDIRSRLRYPDATKDEKGRLRVGAAIGVRGDFLERAEALVNEEVDVLVIDIAHGGIRGSGDLVKALAAGAETAMLGNLLAGTEESPGASVTRNGRQYKVYRGMASLWTSAERRDMPHEDELLSEIVPEGIEAMVPHRGGAAAVLTQLVGGLRSGMSYCGATTLAELRANARFIRVTDAGVREGMPHDVDPLS